MGKIELSEAERIALSRVRVAEKMRNPTGPKVGIEEALAARPSLRVHEDVWLSVLDRGLVAHDPARPGVMVLTDTGRAALEP